MPDFRDKDSLRAEAAEGQQERKMRTAFNRGFRAATLGMPRESPYAGVMMSRLWLDGFDHAVKRNKLFMGTITEAYDDGGQK